MPESIAGLPACACDVGAFEVTTRSVMTEVAGRGEVALVEAVEVVAQRERCTLAILKSGVRDAGADDRVLDVGVRSSQCASPPSLSVVPVAVFALSVAFVSVITGLFEPKSKPPALTMPPVVVRATLPVKVTLVADIVGALVSISAPPPSAMPPMVAPAPAEASARLPMNVLAETLVGPLAKIASPPPSLIPPSPLRSGP